MGSEDNVEQIWYGLRQCIVEEVEAVCGRSKGPPRHRETWWWNDEISGEVERKRCLFLMWKNSEPGEEKTKEEAYIHVGKLMSKSKGSYINQRTIIGKNL